jgi:putative PIN family toxin of toxin-antitoxin system
VRAVVDTNVLVSGLIKRGTPPAEVVADLLLGELVPLYDRRILDEYRDVLVRPRLKIAADKVDTLIVFILAAGVDVPNARFEGQIPDVGDQPFADVAFTGKADLLITGNMKDFPVGRSIYAVTPRDWLDIKKKAQMLRKFGFDERLALEPNDSFLVAVACKRCGRIRTEELRGLSPLAQPQVARFRCTEPDPDQADGRCGGEVWDYDDNDLGRRNARALGIPAR